MLMKGLQMWLSLSVLSVRTSSAFQVSLRCFSAASMPTSSKLHQYHHDDIPARFRICSVRGNHSYNRNTQLRVYSNTRGSSSSSPFGSDSRFCIGTKTDPSEFIHFQQSASVSTAAPVPVELEYDAEVKDDSLESVNISNDNAETTSSPVKKDPPAEKALKRRKTQLKEDLKIYRKQQADYNNKPAYTVFPNAALEGIYALMPTTAKELLNVKGIGPKKVEIYGDDILAIVSNYKRFDGLEGESETKKKPLIRPARIDPATLTSEQRRAAEIPLGIEDRNVFITGSAGTGKSYLLKYLLEEIKQKMNSEGNPKRVGVCAPTGVAAIIVGGNTLHSFFGIGLGTGSISSLLKKVSKNKAAKKRIDETDVLIIDECSMLSSDLLEKLDAISRESRKDGSFREEPFGGMQIIAFGDFYQLPPVTKSIDGGWNDRSHRMFCFDSPVWSDLGLSNNMVELKEVQRQENIEFISLLNKVRIGQVGEDDIRYLNSQCLISESKPIPTDGIVPTRLYVLNKDVDEENNSSLRELEGKEVVCKSVDKWRESMPTGAPAATKKKMKESLSMELPDEIKLKVGAQVMLTRNKDLGSGLVNGSRGVVERFVEDDEGGFLIPIVRFDSGTVTKIDPVESMRFNPDGEKGCLVRMQIPLKLAWAITIHKSQGSTLTRALLDISSAFEYGQCYVALSRVKSLEGLWLEKPARLRNVMVSPQVLDFFSSIR
mmetsp:Transcript_2828/g.3755  ORF Transcript_2828/g.3755 Transcript_2828/m.3755 type:complete len:715 (+) Transcript_2828:105-2249(+)